MFLGLQRPCEPGIQDRASKKLFTNETLNVGGGKYPEPSQKLVSATASRYMILWIASVMQVLFSQWGDSASEHMRYPGFGEITLLRLIV